MQTKLLPTGKTDFESIIKENYYYVDKTMYIPEIESSDSFFFFVRPRRFGKSLFLNMLSSYYDKKQEHNFKDLFSDLFIGKNPTRHKNRYLILHLNFSGIHGRTLDEIQYSFYEYCSVKFNSFLDYYSDIFTVDEINVTKKIEHSEAKLIAICDLVNKKNEKIYLIIDEYDHFANIILTDYGSATYESVTHGIGFFRGFLTVIKKASEKAIERIFLTGVSPVTMDDLTSGFNIAANNSNTASFNAMMGFTEEELRKMLNYYIT